MFYFVFLVQPKLLFYFFQLAFFLKHGYGAVLEKPLPFEKQDGEGVYGHRNQANPFKNRFLIPIQHTDDPGWEEKNGIRLAVSWYLSLELATE